jgi:hypothetical protein
MFILMGIIPDAQAVIKLSGQSVNVMKSKEMTDDQKEEFMRKNSLTMFLQTMKFMLKFILIFVVLFGLLYLTEIVSLPLAEKVAQHFVSVIPMVGLTIATMIYVWIRNVVRRKL